MYIWRHDICHVTASRWCHICQNVSPIPSNRYYEAIFAVGIIKKVTGEKRQGGGTHPPGRPRVNLQCDMILFIHKISEVLLLWFEFSNQGFIYTAVQLGTTCFCGNKYGRYGVTDICGINCGGDASQICGGTFANNILRGELGFAFSFQNNYSQLPEPYSTCIHATLWNPKLLSINFKHHGFISKFLYGRIRTKTTWAIMASHELFLWCQEIESPLQLFQISHAFLENLKTFN